ncbi:MAG: response regulator [Mariprofundus sp.]|nr:response regulator [Mariprofundus sp.]
MEHKKVILIVDDATENIDVLSGILVNDYVVKAATSGERALKIVASKNKPDLILLDVMMPEMDGYEVCRRLKENPKTAQIPVIFVTAMGAVEDEKRGFSLGAIDYITKPVNPPLVLSRVHAQLALYQQKQQLEETVRQRTKEIVNLQLKLMACLGKAGEYRDNETGAHVIRVGKSSELLALAAGCDALFAEKLLFGAPMHDLGKIGIRDEILLKPGKLTFEEFEIMKTHAQIGANIMGQELSGMAEMARGIAMGHHEKWDGSGYPAGLQGEAIPLACRIVAITDVFDALTSARPYKEPWPLDKVIKLFEEQSGRHFDPDLCRIFLTIIPQIAALREEHSDA